MNLIMTIFGFVMFGTLMLSDNNIIMQSNRLAAENELTLSAFTLAQSVLDEAKTKAYDQRTVGGVVVWSKDSMSTALGTDNSAEVISLPDTAEASGFQSRLKFNDIDDYNGYVRIVRGYRVEGDTIRVFVKYASPVNPDSTIGAKSFFKKMIVAVSNPYITRRDNLNRVQPDTLSYVFAY